ncbi:RNA-directed DNA polymerase [Peribacillus simplex]|uniref:RNA-directed DNA polymerase n=1 Tax=Peribacillus simplex TaxID=1478 RepID=A0A8B5Y4G1_9BACI|nr:reverse transcriptase family protein [Peribacillus simplex]TVX83714.1 RNA-directed DNA polymerase [Peribacillus simplex]
MDFSTSKLFGISNKKYVAELLNVEKVKLKNVSSEFVPYRFEQSVKGKKRVLYNPNDAHKAILKKIVRMISQLYLPGYTFGGIKGRNYIDNANVHRNNSYLLLVDIKNFFPSTRDSYIYDLFKNKFEMPPDIAKIFTDLVTVPCESGEGRYLPQGYPTSPILSFFSYLDMYEEILKVTLENNMLFSCYYDDLTLSSNKFIAKSVKRRVTRIIQKYGFEVHPTKSRLVIKRHTKVTGVILKENDIAAPKALLKKLHDTYNLLLSLDKNCTKYTKEEFVDVCNKLQGLISAIKSINDKKKLEMYHNTLSHIRKKYNVPYKRANISTSFETDYGKLIGTLPRHIS